MQNEDLEGTPLASSFGLGWDGQVVDVLARHLFLFLCIDVKREEGWGGGASGVYRSGFDLLLSWDSSVRTSFFRYQKPSRP